MIVHMFRHASFPHTSAVADAVEAAVPPLAVPAPPAVLAALPSDGARS
ncbi:hypothetical protein SMD44_01338 [Streptomyces alboflavus]|uniref:Uncharacterized protein n=1 Tax=Streptomyces alboflavus TaxID=67267 RepID=A0A1Z1W6B0_9ACTN|nr:hypothetical protein SMD44_01338 [Streptomyces alboflavus]